MDDQTKLDRTIWRCCTTVVCLLFLIIGGCNMHANYLYVKGGYKQTTVPSHTTVWWGKP